MRIVNREYHGHSWSERSVIVETADEMILIYIDGAPLLLTTKQAKAVSDALTAAVGACEEVTRQRREAGQ